jgi:aspartyl aminopeptidase
MIKNGLAPSMLTAIFAHEDNLKMLAREHNHDLFAFLRAAKSPFHAVAIMRERLLAAGFTELREEDPWPNNLSGRYLVSRRGGALIAFSVGDEPAASGLTFLACHSDSPALKLKPRPEIISSLP